MSLQRTQSLTFGLALSDLAFEVGAAFAVLVSELCDCGHVDRRVQRAVPASRQTMNRSSTGGELDRSCAGVRSEVITIAEPTDVTGVADQDRRSHWTNSEQVGHRCRRCGNSRTDPFVRQLQLDVEPTNVVEEIVGQVVADLLDSSCRCDAGKERRCVGNVDFTGDATWRELHEQCVQPRDRA